MKNKIDDLRNHLFEVIEKLKDDDIDLDRAKVIADTAQVIVNSAKVECDHMKITGSAGTGFIESQAATPPNAFPGTQSRISRAQKN